MNPSSGTLLWEGIAQDLARVASGGRITSASYRITTDGIYFAAGLLSTREEMLPLWAVQDADISQSITQKARGVSDLILKLDMQTAGRYGSMAYVLKSIKDAPGVRDLILRQANANRQYWNQRHHELEVERRRAGAMSINSPAPASAPAQPAAPVPQTDDLMDRLTKLGEMKQAGLLTDEEFTAAKAKLLGT